ncbi:MAG: Crp/Fnr family transcriptional regulator [Candidatus Izemoplasmataceae bacterium]|uniref:Crp/Fnr family transcriptional regulator n=1 Tax=Liberiplasma polymorphum TaxID=3374570 RepID=UPI0037740661
MLNIINNSSIKFYLSLICVYPKGYVVFNEQDLCDSIGIIINGKLKLSHYSLDGNEFIFSELGKGDVFGDFLIFSNNPYYPGTLETIEESQIVYITKHNLIHLLNTSEAFRSLYISKLSSKALELNLNNKLLRQVNIREKVLFWIDLERKKQNKSKIFIESKEKLSKILSVQRPSLSRELANMKNEKIIDFDRKNIWLIE